MAKQAPRNYKRTYGPQIRSGKAVILTDQQVNAIRNITTGTLKEAAERFGVSEATVSAIWYNKGRFANVPIQ